MTTMRERIARALGEKCLDLRGHGLAFAGEYADAVLDAMREPTREIEIAMNKAIGEHIDFGPDPWIAAIDAAKGGA